MQDQAQRNSRLQSSCSCYRISPFSSKPNLHFRQFRKQVACRRHKAVTTTAVLQRLIGPLVSSNKTVPLNEGIAHFYDESSALWEEMWGQHMHHGYYAKGEPRKSNAEAQTDMIEEVLSWAGVTHASQIVDVGCGIGGSSRHLARKFGAQARGITLSQKQAQRATELSRQQNLDAYCSFQVADALQQPFTSDKFDLVWSLESGEHMPDKRKFVGELVRVCAPDGRIIVVTWCHRNLEQGEIALRKEEKDLLGRVCDAYYLPVWCSLNDYKELFKQHNLQDIQTADWSDEVAPFWGAVIQSAFTGEGIKGLFRAGWTTLKGALVMPLMSQGYKMGTIKFVLITGRKPKS